MKAMVIEIKHRQLKNILINLEHTKKTSRDKMKRV